MHCYYVNTQRYILTFWVYMYLLCVKKFKNEINIFFCRRNGSWVRNKWQNSKKFSCFLTRMKTELSPFRNLLWWWKVLDRDLQVRNFHKYLIFKSFLLPIIVELFLIVCIFGGVFGFKRLNFLFFKTTIKLAVCECILKNFCWIQSICYFIEIKVLAEKLHIL